MLIKEYRIPLPMTVEEYRIAQLYMIQVGLYFRVVSIDTTQSKNPHGILILTRRICFPGDFNFVVCFDLCSP
jgi:hypothetical protein